MSCLTAPEIIAAALTPLSADLAPDGSALAAHCKWLEQRGCSGFLVMGSTGEANSFNVYERMIVLDAVLEQGIDPGKLIVGTGCCAVPDTVALTRHALGLGVQRVLMLPPFYYKGVGEEGLYAAFDQVIQQIGDASLRIYLYHFPRMTGIPITRGLLERLFTDYTSTVDGMKDSGGSLPSMVQTIRPYPGFRVLCGTERYMLDILRAGGEGCMTATLNVTSPLAARLGASWQTTRALPLQAELSELRAAINALPMVPALKSLTARLRADDTFRRMRPPLVPLSAAAEARLEGIADRLRGLA